MVNYVIIILKNIKNQREEFVLREENENNQMAGICRYERIHGEKFDETCKRPQTYVCNFKK